MGGLGDPQGIVEQGIEIWPYCQMVYVQTRIHPREWDTKTLRDFVIQMNHLIQARRPELVIIYKKKKTCCLVDFVVPEDHRVKIKENEKRNKYLDLAKERKKLWNMGVILIPV